MCTTTLQQVPLTGVSYCSTLDGGFLNGLHTHVNEKDMRDIIMFILQICQTDLINGANSSVFLSLLYM